MAKVALLIGVSEYESGLNPLPGAVKDVEAMRRVLVHPEMGGFADANITMLKNPQRQEMEYAIYDLFANRQKDDLLLFYFSGHGVKDESGKLFLSTRATRKDNSGLVTPSAVTSSFLHESLNKSKSERKVMILDCCFSGAISQGMTVRDDGSVNVQEQLGGKGRAILTSSSSTQYSFEQAGSELSIYTRYLVEGIETGAADLDGDGRISVDELHEYTATKVNEESPAMTPKFYPVEEGYKIILAKAPVTDVKLKYRKEVELRAKRGQGKFSLIARVMLDLKRKDWGISVADAQIIEDEILKPFREYERKLQEYEQTFIEAINQENPFSESTKADLKDYQQYLMLRDKDIAEIEERIWKSSFSSGKSNAGSAVEILQTTAPPNYSQTTAPPNYSQTTAPPNYSQTTAPPNYSQTTAPPNYSQTTAPPNYSQTTAPQSFAEELGNGVKLEMVAIPGGTFLMGSPTEELERDNDESPQHSVTVKSFFIGKFAVTQAQWQVVAGFLKINIDLNPDLSRFKGANRPVENMSWHEVIEFCARLSQKTGREYRLPSEAEWEYSCRAGTTTPFHFGETISTDLANYDGNHTYASGSKGIYRKQTTDVGSFPANAFGLYDMHGNVWEWCADRWHENYDSAPTDDIAWLTDNDNDYRLLRGGSWYDLPRTCRSACRIRYAPGDRRVYFGFRVVCARG